MFLEVLRFKMPWYVPQMLEINKNNLLYDNKARSRFELTFNGAPQAYVGEARGPRVHLCHKLFLGVSMRNVIGSQTAELK